MPKERAKRTDNPESLEERYEIMKYGTIVEGIFLERPNRFEAFVEIGGERELVHVKNTGRCTGVLMPGVRVRLEKSDNPKRKTKYDLVMAEKPGFGWINLDSQAPNKVVYEWLLKQGYDYIKPEYTFGDSRVDFYMEKTVDKATEKMVDKATEKYLLEVKGCTLEKDGIGYFPDAPTERGVKHLRELAGAAALGYKCAIAFAIQMEGIFEVRPNNDIHPEFGTALTEAEQAGVEVIFLECEVGEDYLEVKTERVRR